MNKRLNHWLLVLIALFGLPFYWLLVDNHAGNLPAKPIAIDEIRKLAGSVKGPSPDKIEVELVAFKRLPGDFVTAGIGLKRRLIGVMAYRLTVAGGKPIIIDSGMPRSLADCMGMESYYAAAQTRVDKALAEAGLILLTHEHADHMGGLAALASLPHGDAILANARFNAAQMRASPDRCRSGWPPQARLSPSLPSDRPAAVAPGVVVIPAPGHTPGTQMIYLRQANGREYLFAGDISTLAANWQEQRGASRAAAQYLVPEDRAQAMAWLRTIRNVKAQDPGLVVVAGHDFEWLIDKKTMTGITQGFASR